jgi:DNA adenine methylase
MHVSPVTARSATGGTRLTIRPLLKWAGGKRQLIPALAAHYPRVFNRYLEPFVGSGAVFFHLATTGALDGRRVYLSDVNADLIGCYRALRDSTEAVITALAALEREHRKRGDACYYNVRDTRFNPARALLLARSRDESAAAAAYPPDLAAMLIFLNRTGFNGLYRMNRRGLFNVPVGRYTDPRICDAAHLRQVADTFRRAGVEIEYRSFEATLAGVGAGDFVYCDPPYAPLSRTSSFAQYTADGFTAFDQKRLQQAVIAACQRGAQLVVSNSSAQEIVAAYSSVEARTAGLAIQRVPARRAINSRASARGVVDELIISNVVAGPRTDAIETVHVTRPTARKLRMTKMQLPHKQSVSVGVPASGRGAASRTRRKVG